MGSLERARRAASFTAVAVFAASFLTLLVLSATPYWRADNDFLGLCDLVWRVSGVSALVLGAIPHVRRFVRAVAGWGSSGER